MGSFRIAVAMSLFMIAAHPRAASSQDFYEGQMVAGRIAFAAKNHVEANDAFRIAAFGLLERPPLLEEALAYLALSQSALGQTDAAGATIERFLLVEAQFPSWGDVAMDAAARRQFEALLEARGGAKRLAAIPSLAGLIETEEEKLAAMEPRERKRQLELLAQSDPKNPAYPVLLANGAWEERDRRAALRWATRALELDPSLGTMQLLRTRILFADRKCEEALAAEAELAASLVPADEEWRADRFVCLAETKDWGRASEMIPLLPDPVQERSDVRRAIGRVNDALAKEKRDAESRARREQDAQERREAADPGAAQPSPPPGAATNRNQESPVASADPAATSAATTASLARVTTALREGQQMVSAGKYRDAEHHFYDAIVKDPGSRELRLALLEAAALARDWRTADSQIPLVLPLADTEARHLFYAAVTQWELGKREAAREFMKRAKPRLTSSRYVDEYVRRILGDR